MPVLKQTSPTAVTPRAPKPRPQSTVPSPSTRQAVAPSGAREGDSPSGAREGDPPPGAWEGTPALVGGSPAGRVGCGADAAAGGRFGWGIGGVLSAAGGAPGRAARGRRGAARMA